MAPNRKKRGTRVAEIEGEITDAIKRSGDDEAAKAVLGMLDELRKIGVGRSQYNLENPYGRGLAHNHVHQTSDEYTR